MCGEAPPDVVCSEHELTEALVDFAESCTRGFEPRDARAAVDEMAKTNVGLTRWFVFPDVTYRDKTWKEFRFYVRRTGETDYGLWLQCVDNLPLEDVARAAIKKRISANSKR